ncbi:amino acid ABC transporter substrate-binding protein [Rhodococcus sp. 1R11]|uniref:substrate-binding periplasmic protein n=1 Tax=Rhodococcus sp. 1R11 TaxID=2559614 RepID=UPI0010723E41|nr:transporter substrate-binding domain-containing protein [Rhodococcus sp. 1R11]TFI42507.1 amino acid ABC transporter substrate-binding protein [Rhodococcus sp. 1R11]
MKQHRPYFVAIAVTFASLTSLLAACGGSSSSGEVSADCVPAHQFSTIADGTLTVATYDLPPFSKMERGEITGVEGEIVKTIAAKECLTITPNAVAAAAIIPTVQAGRADLAVGDWYRTAAREEVISFSDPLYIDQMALISKEGYTKISDLQGKTVGTVDGYLWVDDMKQYLGDSLKVYPSSLNMNQDLQAGRIDVGIDSFGSGALNNKDSDIKVSVAEPFDGVAASQEGAQAGLPVQKSNPELLAALNADLAEMHANGDIARILTENGLEASAADVGEPRLIG